MPAVSRSTVRAFSGRFLIALVLATSVTTAAVASVNHEIDTRVRRIKRIQLITAEAPPQGENFLIIGSDTREFVDNAEGQEAFGDPGTVTGKNSDTLMVAHVEPSAQRTFVVSFPRDLMVTIPGQTGKNRINSAYRIGGPQLVIDTLSENFDIDIHHYVEVDFKSFQDVVDAIGNVQHVRTRPRARSRNRVVHSLWPGLLPDRRHVRAGVRPVTKHGDLGPERSDRRSGDGRTLALARRARRSRSHPAPAGIHSQTCRRRDREEPRATPSWPSTSPTAYSATSRPTPGSTAATSNALIRAFKTIDVE